MWNKNNNKKMKENIKQAGSELCQACLGALTYEKKNRQNAVKVSVGTSMQTSKSFYI